MIFVIKWFSSPYGTGWFIIIFGADCAFTLKESKYIFVMKNKWEIHILQMNISEVLRLGLYDREDGPALAASLRELCQLSILT